MSYFKTTPDPETLMAVLLRRARRKAPVPSLKLNPLLRTRRRALIRLDFFAKVADSRLSATEESVPRFAKLGDFSRALAPLLVDVVKVKKAVAHFKKTRELIAYTKRKHAIKIAKDDSIEDILEHERAYFGRARSLLKKLAPSIEVLNLSGKKWKEMPNLNESTPTVILAGHPNTGKSTLLARLTDSAPKVAAYPFTTQKLNFGAFTRRHRRVQVVDTPGLLDRPLEERNPVEKKAVLALSKLADLVVWVVDPTQQCGFTLEEQKKLYKEAKKRFASTEFMCVRSKADIAIPKQQQEAKQAFPDSLESGEGIGEDLQEVIFSRLPAEKEEVSQKPA